MRLARRCMPHYAIKEATIVQGRDGQEDAGLISRAESRQERKDATGRRRQASLRVRGADRSAWTRLRWDLSFLTQARSQEEREYRLQEDAGFITVARRQQKYKLAAEGRMPGRDWREAACLITRAWRRQDCKGAISMGIPASLCERGGNRSEGTQRAKKQASLGKLGGENNART